MTEHLRVNGVYWGLTALHIMGHPEALDKEEMIEFVVSCWDDGVGKLLFTMIHTEWYPKYLLLEVDLDGGL